MEGYHPSIVEYYSKQRKSHCGYCASKNGSCSYGLHAHILKVEDYQKMIDRGWRRCGQYCYKSMMEKTCCPLYTIRCAANDFKLSKSQKRIIKKFNNYLSSGTFIKQKIYSNTEIAGHLEVDNLKDDFNKVDSNNLTMEASLIPESCNENAAGKDSKNLSVEPNITEPIKVNSIVNHGKAATSKPLKAKYLRIERKKAKLQKLGLNEEEIAKKLIEKKRYPVVKTLEDHLNEFSTENHRHNLKINLVRSFPRSEEFNNTFDIVFDLYKKYQLSIHKDSPEKLTKHQFERFLVVSPLQIQLVSVNSPDFKNTLTDSSSLFAKYQKAIHHESDEDCDVMAFNSFLVDSPLEASGTYGSYHQQYWLDNKLIAVGVIDILPKCVSSVYFFYDPDYSNLSLGTYGALREVEFARKLSSRFPDLTFYYMGFYIHSCVKMKYKASFKPSFLLCPELFSWHAIADCLPKLNVRKYARFNDDPSAVDVDSNVTISDILILYNRTAMPLGYYIMQTKCDEEERQEIMEYARLVGKQCSKSILLFRM